MTSRRDNPDGFRRNVSFFGRFGAGPLIAGPALVWLACSWYAARRIPALSAGFPSRAGMAVGVVLLFAGVVLYATGMRHFRRALTGELVTDGMFALCRHPFYAIWILFLLPGLGCVLGNWAAILAPAVAWAQFKVLIRFEEQDLEAKFGKAYTDYAVRVDRLWPRMRQR